MKEGIYFCPRCKTLGANINYEGRVYILKHTIKLFHADDNYAREFVDEETQEDGSEEIECPGCHGDIMVAWVDAPKEELRKLGDSWMRELKKFGDPWRVGSDGKVWEIFKEICKKYLVDFEGDIEELRECDEELCRIISVKLAL